MSRSLVDALSNADCYPHAVTTFKLIETHISWVLLTGEFAYKIKKPVKFSFLDFSTLELREHFCNEELRLNKKSASQLYISVVPIYGSVEQASFIEEGEVIEYAVKMRQFAYDHQLDVLLENNKLNNALVDKMADALVTLHQHARVINVGEYGEPEAVVGPVIDNFKNLLTTQEDVERQLEQWCSSEAQLLQDFFRRRKQEGFIRECHGDLHLSNLVLIDDQVVAFDRIEFDEHLYYIDVISDMSFLFMDLLSHGASQSAYRLINRYAEITGDYCGLVLLDFYTVYRAIVRAKVSALRLSQSHVQSEQDQMQQDYLRYRDLALRIIQPVKPILVIMCGLSGSGKSYISENLMSELKMIRIRSDVERKRLFAEKQEADHQGVNALYMASVTDAVYSEMAHVATKLLEAKHSVIVDATFLQQQFRDDFRLIADTLQVNFLTIYCHASTETLRARIEERLCSQQDASDADINVLEQQLVSAELPLTQNDENILTIDTSDAEAVAVLHEHVYMRMS